MIGAENGILWVERAERVLYAGRVVECFGIGNIEDGKIVCYCLCTGLRNIILRHKVDRNEPIILKFSHFLLYGSV